MPRTTRTFEELATSFYLRTPSEIRRFLGVPRKTATEIYKKAVSMDADDGCSYVKRKTVMKIVGISQKDVEEKMRMLEHPQSQEG